MATGSTITNSSISTITGFQVVGEVRYGSNGAIPGTPEYDVVDDDNDGSSGRITWDSGDSGFDSGNVPVTFTANPGGGSSGVSLNVEGGSPIPVTLTTVTYGSIQKVEIRAAVQAPASFTWSGVAVIFYKSGVEIESYTARVGPTADQTGDTPPVAQEQILTVTPSHNDNDKVIVTAYAELTCDDGYNPAPDDIFGQVFLFAST